MFHQFAAQIIAAQAHGCKWHLIFLDGTRGHLGHWVLVKFCAPKHALHHHVAHCIKVLPNPLLRFATCAK